MFCILLKQVIEVGCIYKGSRKHIQSLIDEMCHVHNTMLDRCYCTMYKLKFFFQLSFQLEFSSRTVHVLQSLALSIT